MFVRSVLEFFRYLLEFRSFEKSSEDDRSMDSIGAQKTSEHIALIDRRPRSTPYAADVSTNALNNAMVLLLKHGSLDLSPSLPLPTLSQFDE